MTFPIHIPLFGFKVHPHIFFEVIAYSAGFQLYLFRRSRSRHVRLPFESNMWIIVACIFGALLGSKLLAILESFPQYWANRADPRIWLGGKTIVGGLLGGWVGVELAKKALHIRIATGDLYVFPLILGISIGRVGCFLTGLDDHTHGTPTNLPWAINFGDGIQRHPTQIYEIAFFFFLGLALLLRSRQPHPNGQLFRLFMLAYLAFRFAIEFIKPTSKPLLGLSAIQLASILGVAVCLRSLQRIQLHPRCAVLSPSGES